MTSDRTARSNLDPLQSDERFSVGIRVDGGGAAVGHQAAALTCFSVTYDYRCPFARNIHEHVLDGLVEGALWDVRFVPFSLTQSKDPTWDRSIDGNLYAFEMSIAVRDNQPETFLAVHRALFGLRHDHGGDLRDPDAIDEVVRAAGADIDLARKEVSSGAPLEAIRNEQGSIGRTHGVWGVPTFIVGTSAAFVRLMDRPVESARAPVDVVERVLELITEWPALNEWKHTTTPR